MTKREAYMALIGAASAIAVVALCAGYWFTVMMSALTIGMGALGFRRS